MAPAWLRRLRLAWNAEQLRIPGVHRAAGRGPSFEGRMLRDAPPDFTGSSWAAGPEPEAAGIACRDVSATEEERRVRWV
jgi:hypothetical protein